MTVEPSNLKTCAFAKTLTRDVITKTVYYEREKNWSRSKTIKNYHSLSDKFAPIIVLLHIGYYNLTKRAFHVMILPQVPNFNFCNLISLLLLWAKDLSLVTHMMLKSTTHGNESEDCDLLEITKIISKFCTYLLNYN